jgi:hypothetical protein
MEGERVYFKERLFRWMQFWIYVLVGKLHMKIMQKEHDVPMVGHCGERTTRATIVKRFY